MKEMLAGGMEQGMRQLVGQIDALLELVHRSSDRHRSRADASI